jgi:tetratricopeptide (TPR) repeat protein
VTEGYLTKLEEQLEKHGVNYREQKKEPSSDGFFDSARLFGGSLRALGKWSEALDVFADAFNKASCSQQTDREREFLVWISNVYYHSGRYSRAIEIAARALSKCQNNSEHISILRYYLALPVLRVGDVTRYNELISEALSLFDKKVDPERWAWLQCDKSRALFLQGSREQAAQLVSRQVRTFRLPGHSHKFGLPGALLLNGKILMGMDTDAAFVLLEEAQNLYAENNQEGFVVDCLRLLSKVRYLQERFDEAVSLAEIAIEECNKGPRKNEGLVDKFHLLQVLLWRVYLLLELGDKAKAAIDQQEAMKLLEKCESPYLYKKWIRNQERLSV